jgi:hypothetical protein
MRRLLITLVTLGATVVVCVLFSGGSRILFKPKLNAPVDLNAERVTFQAIRAQMSTVVVPDPEWPRRCLTSARHSRDRLSMVDRARFCAALAIRSC